MFSHFQTAIEYLLHKALDPNTSLTRTLTQALDSNLDDDASVAQGINAAFLVALVGENNPHYAKSIKLLNQMSKSKDWKQIAKFYQSGLIHVEEEILRACEEFPDFANNLLKLANRVSCSENLGRLDNVVEQFWTVFFPEGVGILANPNDRVSKLREKRKVSLDQLNNNSINDPAREILFTSNVLLTLPQKGFSLEHLALSEIDSELIRKSTNEPQIHWYDHPIQIGTPKENNEVVYGLRGLTEALKYEQSIGGADSQSRLTCLLSVSVTHAGLGKIAKNYLRSELVRAGGIRYLDVYIFTERDTQNLLCDIFIPAAAYYLGIEDTGVLLGVFGVDGPYGRHYSFLKAISAYWSILIEPKIRGTFKFDLDQVFPQKELSKNTSRSAFDHLRTPLWGAIGSDINGRKVKLDMIAGALVNESDISTSIFTPDVKFPGYPDEPEGFLFFSKLPQALSTQAEMMARYTSSELDGKHVCLQRVHVTGGTNGILIDGLMKYRPFTPSFIGRAEDQAYILSTFNQPEPKLAYAHESGLIMRHDKEAFAQEAIQSAKVGKLIGDYIRILYFSAYARLLNDDIDEIKSFLDPFTGCFISPIPITLSYLRFSFIAASIFTSSNKQQGLDFIQNGIARISDAIAFTSGENSQLKQQHEIEYAGWNLYYDILKAIADALAEGDEYALSLREKARKITANCLIQLP